MNVMRGVVMSVFSGLSHVLDFLHVTPKLRALSLSSYTVKSRVVPHV